MKQHYYTKHLMLAALAACALCTNAAAQTWDGTSAACTKGDGTAENPYLIETPQQLAWLSDQVNDGETFEGKHFKLTADLNMGGDQGHTFNKIGIFDKTLDTSTMQEVDASKYFKGTLDGDKHIIENLYINHVDEELGGTGLFACTTDGTVIRNLIIGSGSTLTGGITSGMFVGQMNGGVLEYCENRGAVNANLYSGALVGVIEAGIVRYCSNSGRLYAATEIGGIVGQGAGDGKVSYCYNTGEIEAYGFGGGGIGGALYETFAIANCYSTGKVSGQTSLYMGAPHAVVSDPLKTNTISNCYYVSELAGVDDPNATAVTADELKQPEFLDRINNGEQAFVADDNNRNGGFPILGWQADRTSGVKTAGIQPAATINLDGNTVVCDRAVSVYTIEGTLVASGNDITLAPGTYVLQAGGSVKKVVVK